VRITDSTSGFRLQCPSHQLSDADHFPCDYPDADLLLILHRAGFRITERPCACIQQRRAVDAQRPPAVLLHFQDVSFHRVTLIRATRRDGGAPMTANQKIFALMCASGFRDGHRTGAPAPLREEYSVLWLTTSLLMFVLVLRYEWLEQLTHLIVRIGNDHDVPRGVTFLLLIVIQFSIKLSQISNQLKNLGRKMPCCVLIGKDKKP